MSRLSSRIADLEKRLSPVLPPAWVRVFQYQGQTQGEALAAWEAEHGPVGDRNVIMRVIIHKPFPPEGRPRGGAMSNLNRRVESLEKRVAVWQPMRLAVQRVGMTREEAIANAEAQDGPIGDVDVLVIRLVRPEPRIAA